MMDFNSVTVEQRQEIVRNSHKKVERLISDLEQLPLNSEKKKMQSESVQILKSFLPMLELAAQGEENFAQSSTAYLLLVIQARFVNDPFDCDEMCSVLLRMVHVVETIKSDSEGSDPLEGFTIQ